MMMPIKRVITTFTIMCGFQIIQCAPGMDDTKEESKNYWTENVKEAVTLFTREYESQHECTVIIPDLPQLEKTAPFELGIDNRVFGIFKLPFSFRKDGQECQSSVYLKVPKLDNYVEELSCYEKEKFMYGAILPVIHGSEPNEKFSPNFYGSTESNVIIVENTREAGFHPIDDFLYNLDMCIRVFETLARFHALSIIRVEEQHMKKLDQFNEKRTFSFGLDDMENFIIFKKFVKHIYPGLSKKTHDRVSYVMDESDKARDLAYIVDETAFNVIIIGDLTRLNVFFRGYDKVDTQLLECKFIDFHMSRRGSPVIDLISYLMTSVDVGLVERQVHKLFQSYLKELKKQLQISSVDDKYKYDLRDLLADLRKYRDYFLYKLIFHMCQFNTNFAPSCEPGRMDRDVYDDLFESNEFILYFLDWMDIISAW